MISLHQPTPHEIFVKNTKILLSLIVFYIAVLCIITCVFKWNYSEEFRMGFADVIYRILELLGAEQLYGWFNAWSNNSL